MKLLLLLAVLLLSGCSTLNRYGIGGAPLRMCDSAGRLWIDDRIVGPDGARLSVMRRFADGDALCLK
jgi:hypothetical protein